MHVAEQREARVGQKKEREGRWGENVHGPRKQSFPKLHCP